MSFSILIAVNFSKIHIYLVKINLALEWNDIGTNTFPLIFVFEICDNQVSHGALDHAQGILLKVHLSLIDLTTASIYFRDCPGLCNGI